jgi:hypothetical protein
LKEKRSNNNNNKPTIAIQDNISPKIQKIRLYNAQSYEKVAQTWFQESGNAHLLPVWVLNNHNHSEHTDYYRDESDTGEPFIWCPLKIKTKTTTADHSIYFSIVNKMDYLERLIERFSNAPSHVIRALRSIQDQYHLLSLHMEMKSQYSNNEVMKRPTSSGAATTSAPLPLLSPYEMYRPSTKSTIFDMEELPDLFVHVIHCEFWGDYLDPPFADEEMNKIIKLLSKALPYACKGRSVTSIIPNIIPEIWVESSSNQSTTAYPSIYNIIIRLLMGSLLGVYEHCKVTANFRVRRKIYKWFYMCMPSSQEIRKWVAENKYLIIYVMREYLFFCIQGIPALSLFMQRNYFWSSIVENTYSSMDDVRKSINNMIDDYSVSQLTYSQHGDFVWQRYLQDRALMGNSNNEQTTTTTTWSEGKSWFIEANSILENAHKNNLQRCHRPIESNFLTKIVNIITNINDSHFSKASQRQEQPQLLNEEAKRVIDEVVERYDPVVHGANPYDWLMELPVKVSYRSVKKLRDAELLYVRETSRSEIDTVMGDIYKSNQYDYQVFSYYFIALYKRKAIRCYDLPYHMTTRQVATDHKIYETAPGDSLPEAAGVYFICTNCGKFKAPIHKYSSTMNPKRKKDSLYSSDVCIDMMDGTFTCTKISSKNNPKKRNSTNDLVNDIINRTTHDAMISSGLLKENKKSAKLKRKHEMFSKCPHTQLVQVNMNGRLLRTEDGLIVKCPECSTITTLSRANYKNSGSIFSCGCIRFGEPKRVAAHCHICNHDIPADKDKEPVRRLVYDDVTDLANPRVRHVEFCEAHRCDWLNSWKELLPLSEIRENVRQGNYSVQLSNGDRVFVENRIKSIKRI